MEAGETDSIYSQVGSNKRKTWFIIFFFVLLLSTIGYLIGQVTGHRLIFPALAITVSLAISGVSFFFGDRMALSISNAKKADRDKDVNLITTAENMTISASLPKPKVFIIEDPSLNAFATGRDPQHASICVTRGLVEKLGRYEIEGVVAHEISHILNYDSRLMLVILVLVGTVAHMSDFFLHYFRNGSSGKKTSSKGKLGVFMAILGMMLAVTAPFIASLLQIAISRKREYLADAQAALLTRNPDALADALEKISESKTLLSSASPATAHLFIANPYSEKESLGFLMSLFDTHPPIAKRVKILRAM